MNQNLFLKQYKYEMPASSVALLSKKRQQVEIGQEPVLCAFFDFENGQLQLEGDCHLILDPKKEQKNSWCNYYKNRVFIDATMRPEISPKSAHSLTNEFVMYIKGSIYDGERRGLCSGLLSLTRTWNSSKVYWVIYCNLVDNDLDVFEIKFRLPVYTNMFEEFEKN